MKASRDGGPSQAEYLARRPARFKGYERRSEHLEMCLPRGGGGERLPAVLRQTRYFRRFRVNPVLRPLLDELTLDPTNGPMRQLFTSRG